MITQEHKNALRKTLKQLSSSLMSTSFVLGVPRKRKHKHKACCDLCESQNTSEVKDRIISKINFPKQKKSKTKVIVPLTNKDLLVDCTSEEKEAIRIYVNTHPGDIKDQRYWKEISDNLALNYTPEMMRLIYVQYYEEKLKSNEATLIKYETEEDYLKSENSFSIQLIPAPRRKVYSLPKIIIKPKIIVPIKKEENSKEIDDNSQLERLMKISSEEKIMEKFKKVVKKCREFYGNFVTEREVLEVLMKNEGDVKMTLEYFQPELEKIEIASREAKIPEKFQKLLEKCRELSNKNISESEVLEALSNYSGDIKQTLIYFQSLNNLPV